VKEAQARLMVVIYNGHGRGGNRIRSDQSKDEDPENSATLTVSKADVLVVGAD